MVPLSISICIRTYPSGRADIVTGISLLSMSFTGFRGACTCGIPIVIRFPAASYVKIRAVDCAMADDDKSVSIIIRNCLTIDV